MIVRPLLKTNERRLTDSSCRGPVSPAMPERRGWA
jgi:hypothetical protein